MNTKIIKTGILSIFHTLLFLTVIAGAIAQAANITVTTSRNPVSLDDSFHLIYEADSSVDDDPDFSPIYQHFDVLNSSQSTNMRSINGNWSMKKTWDLAVMAKDIGKFTIPPINFGIDISPAIQITITSSTSPNSTSPGTQSTIPAKIFLESSIDKKQGWVQSQFIYSIRLLRTVSIASASLTAPETSDPDAIIHQISEDNYQTTRNGIQYEVIERRYAIFPQKSGPLTIKPVTFEGRINATQPRTIFDQFRMSGQLKRLRSKPVKATVKAVSAAINLQNWLPASNVQLIEEWSNDIQNIKTGEPVTRTITIAAEGLTAVQLPELDFADIDNLKQYPDKPVTENKQSINGITGLKQVKVALIPATAGTYTLPEIKLQWWNTKTGQTETASIPETVITATGIAYANKPAMDAVNEIDETSQKKQTAQENKLLAPVYAEQVDTYWKWSSLVLALLWLFTLLLLLKKSKLHKNQDNIKSGSNVISVKKALSSVEKCAKNNDAHNTKIALIEWARQVYKDKSITNLSQISKYCSTRLNKEIKQLNQALYSPEKPTWHGKTLLNAFKDEQTLIHSQHETHASSLKPLYQQ